MKKILGISVLALVMLFTSSCAEKKAKYVFLFIGDGMGFSHVSTSEAYLAQRRGEIGMDPLCFSSFPVMGEATTFSANSQITCSSAAGTALSTGFKTNNYMLGVDPDTLNLTSISYKIHDAGYGVGIMSNVQVNHATPAAFYGHSAKRSDYYEIGQELGKTGFDFFAGGGFIQPLGKDNNAPVSLYDIAREDGYEVVEGVEGFKNRKSSSRILMVQEDGSDKICPYAIDRSEDALTLSQMVASAIEVLEQNEKGFFVMAEGGLIDWAAHGQDLPSTVMEVLDMDQAVQIAFAFYEKHPDETLIIVTADHETGGIALGRKGSKLDLTYIDSVMVASTTTDVEDYMSDKISIAEISEKARVGWTTTGHCGGAVPVWAIGAGSQLFSGRQDNTDIPKKICKAMGIEF